MKEKIKRNMEIIGADGVPVGRVEEVHGHCIRLAPQDLLPGHAGLPQAVDLGLVAAIEGHQIRLSANADLALSPARQAPAAEA
ncbi:DUF2171 domain-containing protein [Acidisoma sp. C75]